MKVRLKEVKQGEQPLIRKNEGGPCTRRGRRREREEERDRQKGHGEKGGRKEETKEGRVRDLKYARPRDKGPGERVEEREGEREKERKGEIEIERERNRESKRGEGNVAAMLPGIGEPPDHRRHCSCCYTEDEELGEVLHRDRIESSNHREIPMGEQRLGLSCHYSRAGGIRRGYRSCVRTSSLESSEKLKKR